LPPQWLELGLREALRRDGRQALEDLLNDPGWRVAGDQRRLGEKCYAARPRLVGSLFGEVRLCRNYYTDGQGGGRAPLDEALGMVEGCTPAWARLMCRAGAVEHYEAAAASLHAYTGLTVVGRHVQRMVSRLGPQMAQWPRPEAAVNPPPAEQAFYVEADGTGIPVRSEETAGRKGKQADQAKTREVKLGSVFTQTQKDEEGNRCVMARALPMSPRCNRRRILGRCSAPKPLSAGWHGPVWSCFWATGPPGCGNWPG